MYQKILSSEVAERRFDPRRRFTGQMPDFKGIYQEGCYVSPHYQVQFFTADKTNLITGINVSVEFIINLSRNPHHPL